MKGVGRIYQQTFIDTYSRVAFAKLYIEKTGMTAAHALNEAVFPWFALMAVRVVFKSEKTWKNNLISAVIRLAA